MLQVLDRTLEAEVLPLPAELFKQMYRDYKAKRGAHPKSEGEPTEEQVSAVAQVVENGIVLYADMTIIGKHGARMLAKLLYVAFSALTDGKWQRRELPVPPSYSAWCASWRVFRTTLLLLDAASTEVLD